MSDEGFDINALLNQAMAMQQQMAEAQEQAASQSVEGQAGGGAVRVTMTGGGEVTAYRSHQRPSIPPMLRCSRISCSPPSTTLRRKWKRFDGRRSARSAVSGGLLGSG